MKAGEGLKNPHYGLREENLMTQLTLQKATLKDLEAAANDLSLGDLQEYHSVARNRPHPNTVLPGYLDDTTMVIKVGALVLAVGGSKDCLWFVTTNVVDMLTKRQRLQFLRLLKGHLKGLPQEAHKTNFVSVANHPHIRLLTHLGSIFSDQIKMSGAGFAFRQFWL